MPIVVTQASAGGGGLYSATDALNYIKEFVKSIPSPNSQNLAFNAVGSIMYVHRPWRWTLGALTPISLVDNIQDYTVSNGDLFRPLKLRLRRTDTDPDEYRAVDLVDHLEPDLVKMGWNTVQLISYQPQSQKIRLQFTVGLGAGQAIQIEGEYQKTPVRLTASSASFWFPDQYFQVFLEGLLWQFYRLSDDLRAGSAQKMNGRMVFSGQLGVFMTMLDQMAVAEDFGSGESFTFPSTVLGVKASSGGISWPLGQ